MTDVHGKIGHKKKHHRHLWLYIYDGRVKLSCSSWLLKIFAELPKAARGADFAPHS